MLAKIVAWANLINVEQRISPIYLFLYRCLSLSLFELNKQKRLLAELFANEGHVVAIDMRQHATYL